MDITKYNIYVDDDVFVAIEQISNFEESKNQIAFSVKLFDSMYVREASQGNWAKLPVGFGLWVDAEY